MISDSEYLKIQIDIEEMIMARQTQKVPETVLPQSIFDEEEQGLTKTPSEAKVDSIRLNQALGFMNAAETIGKFSNVARLVQLQQVKKEKIYIGAEIQHCVTGEIVTIRTWEEFCTKGLNLTVRTIDEQLQNLNLFGADALESMQKIGITGKEFRQLRALAKEDESNVIEVIANATTAAQTNIEIAREQLLELIDKQAEKHTREKDALKQAQEQAEKQAKQKEDELQAQLQRAERTVKNKEQELADSRAMLTKKIDLINQLVDEKHEQETMSVDKVESNLIAGFAEYGHRLINGAIAQRVDEPFLGAVGLRQVVNKLKDFYTKEKGEPDIPPHVQLQIVDFAKQMNAVLQGVIEDFNLDNSGIGEYEDVEYIPEPTTRKTFL